MPIGRHGFAAVIGVGAEVGGAVAEVGVTQETDNRNRDLAAFEFGQDVFVKVGAASSRISKKSTLYI